MKSVQIRSIFWSQFYCIRTEYGDLLRKVIQENTDKKTLRIWTLFTQCSCDVMTHEYFILHATMSVEETFRSLSGPLSNNIKRRNPDSFYKLIILKKFSKFSWKHLQWRYLPVEMWWDLHFGWLFYQCHFSYVGPIKLEKTLKTHVWYR